MPLQITLNGQPRELPIFGEAVVTDLLQHLDLKGDRVAVEQNGTIVARASWTTTSVRNGDRFEIVHFVGGGSTVLDADVSRPSRSSHLWP